MKTFEGRVVAGRDLNKWILECALASQISLQHPFYWRYPEDETQLFPRPKNRPDDDASESTFSTVGGAAPRPTTSAWLAAPAKRYSSFDYLLQRHRKDNTRGAGERSDRDDVGQRLMRSFLAAPVAGRGKPPVAMPKPGR